MTTLSWQGGRTKVLTAWVTGHMGRILTNRRLPPPLCRQRGTVGLGHTPARFPTSIFSWGPNPTVAGVSESVAPPAQRGLCLFWLNKRLPLGGGQTKGLCPCDSPCDSWTQKGAGRAGPASPP